MPNNISNPDDQSGLTRFRAAMESVGHSRALRSSSMEAPPLIFSSDSYDEDPFYEDDYDLEDFMPDTVSRAFRMQVDNSSIQTHPFVIGTDKVGVEIELENIRYEMPRSVFWKDKDDGSLRNSGHEYVFRQPFGGKDLLTALQEIDSYLHDKNADASWRCSTHVHLDVRDLTAQQVKFLLITYAVYERLIFKCAGWHRFKNNFCPAFSFAQGQVMMLSRNWSLSGESFLQTMANSWSKYSCLNLIPMRTQGSVEFRMSEAKRHKGQLLRLCNRILTMKQIAKGWTGSEMALIEHLMTVPPTVMFGPKCLPKGFESDPNDQMLGAKLAIDMIHLDQVRYKSVRDMTDRLILIPRIRQWREIARFARSNDYTQEGIDFSDDEHQPRQLTFGQLRKLSSNTLLSLQWFFTSDDEYMLYTDYCTHMRNTTA